MNRSSVLRVLLGTLLGLTACGSDEPAPGDVADTSADVADSSADVGDVADISDGADADLEGEDGLASDALELADAADTIDAADAATPRDWSARGPFAVGYRVESITYEANDGTGPRTLRLAVWYPTRATTGDDVRYADLLPAAGVLGGAAPASDLGPRPVVVFSHGNTSFAEQSFFFNEFLASHGFLVAAPDHTGNTYGSGLVVEILHRRPADVSAVLDHLEALPESDPLAALVGDRVAVAGHSFGGYTALAVGGAQWDVDMLEAYCAGGSLPGGGCEALETYGGLYRAGFLDPRVDALVPMTPGAVILFGGDGVDEVALPTLLMTSALDGTTPNATDGDVAWAQLEDGPDNVRVDLSTGGHFTYSDACSLPIAVGLGDGCGADFLPAADAHRAINAYAFAFLSLHLLDDRGGEPLLSGAVTIEPDVVLSHGR